MNEMNISLRFTDEQKGKFHNDLAAALRPELEKIVTSVIKEEFATQGNVFEEIKNLKEKIEYYGDRGPNINFLDDRNDENEKNNSFMKHYRESIRKIEEKIIDWDNEFKTLNGYIREIKEKEENMIRILFGSDNESGKLQELNNKVAKIQPLVEEITTIKSTTDGLQNNIAAIMATLKEDGYMAKRLEKINDNIEEILQVKNAEYQKALEKAVKADELESQLERVNKLLESKTQDYDNLFKSNKELTQKLESEKEKYSSDIAEKNSKIEEHQKELVELQGSKQNVDNKLEKWNMATEKYRPVQESMEKSTIFKKFLDDRNLSGDGDELLFTYAVNIGSTLDFAVAVHDYMSALKKENFNPISQEEKAVYAALNKCYRGIWGIDFDIFSNPGGKLVTEDATPTLFDRSESENLKDPRRPMKNITAIYVPILKNRLGKIQKTAKVDTSN